jgi:hypothetical protein
MNRRSKILYHRPCLARTGSVQHQQPADGMVGNGWIQQRGNDGLVCVSSRPSMVDGSCGGVPVPSLARAGPTYSGPYPIWMSKGLNYFFHVVDSMEPPPPHRCHSSDDV